MNNLNILYENLVSRRKGLTTSLEQHTEAPSDRTAALVLSNYGEWVNLKRRIDLATRQGRGLGLKEDRQLNHAAAFISAAAGLQRNYEIDNLADGLIDHDSAHDLRAKVGAYLQENL